MTGLTATGFWAENGLVLATVVGMGCATYLTRIVGFVALRNRQLGPRASAVMNAAPGCVLISVIAPYFVADRPADLIAIGITALLATRFSMLPTVVFGVLATGILRHIVN